MSGTSIFTSSACMLNSQHQLAIEIDQHGAVMSPCGPDSHLGVTHAPAVAFEMSSVAVDPTFKSGYAVITGDGLQLWPS